jgi:hypothetical protein
MEGRGCRFFLFNEIVAYEIANKIGLQSAKCILAKYKGVNGVLSEHVNETYGCYMIGYRNRR